MNKTPTESVDFMHELYEELKGKEFDTEWAIAAPFISLPYILPHVVNEEDNERCCRNWGN